MVIYTALCGPVVTIILFIVIVAYLKTTIIAGGWFQLHKGPNIPTDAGGPESRVTHIPRGWTPAGNVIVQAMLHGESVVHYLLAI